MCILRALSANTHFLLSTFPYTSAHECIFCPAITYSTCSGLFHSDWQVNSCLPDTSLFRGRTSVISCSNPGTHTVTAPHWYPTQSNHFGSSVLQLLPGQLSRATSTPGHAWSILINLNLLVTFAAPTSPTSPEKSQHFHKCL